MTRPAVGAPAPDFRLPATGGQTLSLADFRGRNVVLQQEWRGVKVPVHVDEVLAAARAL